MEKYCFFVSSISKNRRSKEWSNKLYKKVVTPVLVGLSYKMIKQDSFFLSSAKISLEVLKYFVEADLVVADITEDNPILYYGLAIRHVFRKPIVYLGKANKQTRFNNEDIKLICVKMQNLKQIVETQGELRTNILNLEVYGVEASSPLQGIHGLEKKFADSRFTIEKKALLNLFDQFNSIHESLDNAKGDLVILNDRLISAKEKTMTQSPFVRRRLMKAGLIERQ